MHSIKHFTFSAFLLSESSVTIHALKEKDLNVDETNLNYKLNVQEDAQLY